MQTKKNNACPVDGKASKIDRNKQSKSGKIKEFFKEYGLIIATSAATTVLFRLLQDWLLPKLILR
jgi:hypothetical protein